MNALSFKLFPACLASVCLIVAGAWAEPAAPAQPVIASPARVSTKSASGRFLVIGSDSAANSQYTRWAEDIAGRMSRLFETPLPSFARTPLEIVCVYGKSAGPALTVECRPGGSARRILTVNESRNPDYERMQESLCALLLDGWVEDRRRILGRAPGDCVVPGWFSMGVSQNLAAETRNRNRKVVTGWLPVSERPAVVSVLEWRSLPEGWPRNWALCGMVVHWLGSLKEGSSAYTAILDRLAEGKPVQSEWVAARMGRMGSVAALEQEWRDWLSRQSRAIQEFGALSTVLVEQLKSELDLVFPAEPEAGQRNRPLRRLTPAQVVDERERSTALRLSAAEKIQKIRAITIGKAPELVEVGEAYCLFFESVSRDAWNPLVRRRFTRAEDSLNRLARLTRAREALLDEIEREESDGLSREGIADSAEPNLEKSRIDAYLDDVEKRFTKPAGNKAD